MNRIHKDTDDNDLIGNILNQLVWNHVTSDIKGEEGELETLIPSGPLRLPFSDSIASSSCSSLCGCAGLCVYGSVPCQDCVNAEITTYDPHNGNDINDETDSNEVNDEMDESESMALGMDIGGSMIRVVVMPSILQDNGTRRRRFQRAHTQHTQRNKEQEPTIYHYKVPESIKVGPSSHYFTFLATCISSTLSSISASADVRSDTMIRGSAEEDKCVEVGISWSFPISPASSLPSSTSSTSPTRQTQTRPLKMGKGYEFTDSKTLTQSSLIPHFEAAFERVGIGARISIQWILNDTIAALVYAGHISRSCLCENQRDRENQGEKRVRKERRTLGI